MDGQMGAQRESPFLWRREDFRLPQADDTLHWLETSNTLANVFHSFIASFSNLGKGSRWRTRCVHKFRCQVSGDNAGPDPIFDLDSVQPVILLLQREREWKTEQSVKDEAGSGYSIDRPGSVVPLYFRQKIRHNFMVSQFFVILLLLISRC